MMLNKDTFQLYIIQFIQILLGALTIKFISNYNSQEIFGIFLIIMLSGMLFELLCMHINSLIEVKVEESDRLVRTIS